MKISIPLISSLFCLSALAATPPLKYNVFSTNTLARATFVPTTGVFSLTNSVQLNSNLLSVGATELRGANTITQIASALNVVGALSVAAPATLNSNLTVLGGTTLAGANTITQITSSVAIENTLVSGAGNSASTLAAAVGGRTNSANGSYSFMGGGTYNTNFAANSAVVGGTYNNNQSSSGVIIGGIYNYNAGNYSVILGGRGHVNTNGNYSVIIGGETNIIGDTANRSVIVGGAFNKIDPPGVNVVLIGVSLTNTVSREVKIGWGDGALSIRPGSNTYAGQPLLSFILTNGIAGVYTNFTYFTNGFPFTNIGHGSWVAWP